MGGAVCEVPVHRHFADRGVYPAHLAQYNHGPAAPDRAARGSADWVTAPGTTDSGWGIASWKKRSYHFVPALGRMVSTSVAYLILKDL